MWPSDSWPTWQIPDLDSMWHWDHLKQPTVLFWWENISQRQMTGQLTILPDKESQMTGQLTILPDKESSSASLATSISVMSPTDRRLWSCGRTAMSDRLRCGRRGLGKCIIMPWWFFLAPKNDVLKTQEKKQKSDGWTWWYRPNFLWHSSHQTMQ